MSDGASGTKKCSKCGEVKEWGEFHKDRCRKFGLRSECKECTRDRDRSPKRRAFFRAYARSPKRRTAKRDLMGTKEKSGCVYFASDAARALVKVGFTSQKRPEYRISQVQCGHPFSLQVRAFVATNFDETDLLTHLRSIPGSRDGLDGGTEWFRLTPEVQHALDTWAQAREERKL